MSLINDALKRAKEAQGQAPPPELSGPKLQLAAPVSTPSRSGNRIVPVVAGIVVITVSLVVAWKLGQHQSVVQPGAGSNSARTPSSLAPAATKSDTPAAPERSITQTEPAAAPRPGPEPAVAPSNDQPVTATISPGSSSAPAVPSAPAQVVTEVHPTPAASESVSNAVTSEAAALAKSPPLKLQAIVYHPSRPSAMISGKTVFVGDWLGDLRVVSIGQQSAILAGAGETKVLTLPQ